MEIRRENLNNPPAGLFLSCKQWSNALALEDFSGECPVYPDGSRYFYVLSHEPWRTVDGMNALMNKLRI